MTQQGMGEVSAVLVEAEVLKGFIKESTRRKAPAGKSQVFWRSS